MILFALETYRCMAAALEKSGDLRCTTFRALRFENGELHAEIPTSVENEHCLILGSIAPPDEQLLSVLLLAHTLKKERALRVTAILPYLAYARDDKDKPGASMATGWVARLSCASGIDEVITVDIHSERARALYSIPVVSLSPATIFAQAIGLYDLRGATIVAPDNGAIGRCRDVRAAAGMRPSEIPYFEKQRTAAGVRHLGLIGTVGPQALIVDDILDTGSTLVSACEMLNQGGVSDISIMVTHGLFTRDRWRRLPRLGVKRIFCTDSVPLPPGVDETKIVRLSVVPLLAEWIHNLRTASSTSRASSSYDLPPKAIGEPMLTSTAPR